MSYTDKIEILGNSAKFDICASSCFTAKGAGRQRAPYGLPRWVYPAVRPDGKRILLMKVLMANACRNNCAYCLNRCGGKGRPTAFSPDELVRTFLDLRQQGLAEGLFLSSAVENDNTMSRMLDAVEILRNRVGFNGYIHLKVLPGASFCQVERAVELANRVSVNLEAANAKYLGLLAPDKNFHDDLFVRMKWIHECLGKRRGFARGHTTQFIVGATPESDREILETTTGLYKDLALERAYFSAFQPIAGTPLEDALPAPLLREHRLYQADFLLRQYRWRQEDFIFQPDGNLSLKEDPKYIWARNHPEQFPVEVNRAELEELLRVPGIGPRSARRILKLRSRGKIFTLQDLRTLGAVARRAAPFVLINGRPQGAAPEQLSL